MMTQSIEEIQKTNTSAAPECIAVLQESQTTQMHAKNTESLAEKPQILEELVIEEVSIDGMCGVY